MSRAEPAALLLRLATRARVEERVALVVAHPDDETLGLGASLRRFKRLTLIHLTDGAPRDLADARRAGCASAEAYADLRQRELDEALRAAEARPIRRLAYAVPDQTLVHRLPEIVDRLAGDLAGCEAVVTHAYEGGHPDHDSAALAVQAACARLGDEAPVRLEFAGYHECADGLRCGVFADAPTLEMECDCGQADLARKSAALARHASQRDTLARVGFGPERLRLAPTYDFAAPPASGQALYDGYGWTLTAARWRELAAPWAA